MPGFGIKSKFLVYFQSRSFIRSINKTVVFLFGLVANVHCPFICWFEQFTCLRLQSELKGKRSENIEKLVRMQFATVSCPQCWILVEWSRTMKSFSLHATFCSADKINFENLVHKWTSIGNKQELAPALGKRHLSTLSKRITVARSEKMSSTR